MKFPGGDAAFCSGPAREAVDQIIEERGEFVVGDGVGAGQHQVSEVLGGGDYGVSRPEVVSGGGRLHVHFSRCRSAAVLLRGAYAGRSPGSGDHLGKLAKILDRSNESVLLSR